MENKDLIWADYVIDWPTQNHYYYREEDAQVLKNELDVLASLLRAEQITVEITDHTSAWIKYNAQKNTLDYSGLKILITFPEYVNKVHFGGKYYAC